MPVHRIAKRAGRLLATAGQTAHTVGLVYDTDTSKMVMCSTGTTCAEVLTDGGVSMDRVLKTAKVALSGTSIHSAAVGWTNPESAAIVIVRAVVDLTTVSTTASTLNVGVTSTAITSTSGNLINAMDANAATGVFDNITDKGSAGKSRQRLASAKWVTVSEGSGDATGAVANLYVTYFLV